ncbi:MAG: hypothetical protein ACRD0G_17010 [Acidimicrobiales bacterium]
MRIDLAEDRTGIEQFPSGGERLWEARGDDGSLLGRLDANGEAGYLLSADGYGHFLIASDGTDVRCAPYDSEPWRWQRYLIGQVLPLVAVLRGLEVFHSSVVETESGGTAFFGPSGSGKSSLAVGLMLRGARFLTDDVMAVEIGRSATTDQRRAAYHAAPVFAHPGFGVANIRHAVARQLTPDDLGVIGQPIGDDDEAVRLAVAVAGPPVRIGAVYFLERAPRSVEPHITEIDAVDPRLLLVSSYNFVIRTPDRLVRQLDVCSRLARSARMFRLTTPPNAPLAAVAACVQSHSSALARSA